jgi:hypothetical protein
MIFKMKQAVVISILIVSLVSFAYSADDAEIKETERSLGGTTLLDGDRRNSQYEPSYQKEVSNLQQNNRVQQGIVNYNPPLAASSIANPSRQRTRRAAPRPRYNRDGTISLRCRYSPLTCRGQQNRRRSRRGGQRLLSLYLKPPAEDGSSLNNLFKKFHPGRRAPPRVRQLKQSKGKRILSISLKSPTPRPVQKVPSTIYGRAFQRFTKDITPNFISPSKRTTNRRISKPRPRGRRAPPRQRIPKRKARKGQGKEIFSLFLKPPGPKRQGINLPNPYFPRQKQAPAKADIPLICRFQPAKCGRKGQKLFSIYYKGFKNVFPNAFPIL